MGTVATRRQCRGFYKPLKKRWLRMSAQSLLMRRLFARDPILDFNTSYIPVGGELIGDLSDFCCFAVRR